MHRRALLPWLKGWAVPTVLLIRTESQRKLVTQLVVSSHTLCWEEHVLFMPPRHVLRLLRWWISPSLHSSKSPKETWLKKRKLTKWLLSRSVCCCVSHYSRQFPIKILRFNKIFAVCFQYESISWCARIGICRVRRWSNCRGNHTYRKVERKASLHQTQVT